MHASNCKYLLSKYVLSYEIIQQNTLSFFEKKNMYLLSSFLFLNFAANATHNKSQTNNNK